jgi:hypothetical protein
MLRWTIPLRPAIITYLGHLRPNKRGQFITRDGVALIGTILVAIVLYLANVELFTQIKRYSRDQLLLTRFLDLTFIALFLMAALSSVIVAINQLFSANDTNILISAPLAGESFFLARFTQISLQAGWLFLLFAMPVAGGLATTFELPIPSFALLVIMVATLLTIACALGTAVAVIFSAILPSHRLREVILIVAICISALVLMRPPTEHSLTLAAPGRNTRDLVADLRHIDLELPTELPSHLAALIAADISLERYSITKSAMSLLLLYTVGALTATLLIFDLGFKRGLYLSQLGQKGKNVRSGRLSEYVFLCFFPFNQQLRAIARKEAKMFLRDTSQAIQLMLLLVLTAVYVRNLGAMQKLTFESEAHLYWWQIILGTANVTFGCCIISAIATRFVFPSISLEGQAIVPLKASPVSMEQFLNSKALIWFIPLCLLSCILFVTGSLAVSNNAAFIGVSGLLGALMAMGVVRLAVGFGAIYSQFDWDSPSQVTSSVGSIMFVLAVVGLTAANTLPAFFLFTLFGIPGLKESMGYFDFWNCVMCSILLIGIANVWAGSRAIRSGVAAI